MPTGEHLRDLVRHLGWADATVWQAILANQPSSLDSKLGFWLHHIHMVQHAFTRLWRGEGLDLPQLSELGDPQSLAQWGRQASLQIQAYLADASPADLDRELAIPWSARVEARFGQPAHAITVAESVLQVAMHSAHHRGQVNARFRELGGSPPLVDFIAWLWFGRPEAQWPGAPRDGSQPHPGSRSQTRDDESAIRALAEEWHAGWMKSDAQALVALYSDEPVLLPQNQPAIRGRETIRQLYESVFREFVVEGGGELLGLGVDGDLGYFWSTYALTATPREGGGKALADSGNSVFIVRRQRDGVWRITHLISNSDRPPAEEPPFSSSPEKTAPSGPSSGLP